MFYLMFTLSQEATIGDAERGRPSIEDRDPVQERGEDVPGQ